jgi:hypothetical protein
MDLIESYLILKVKNKDTRNKIKKLMSQPDFFRHGETNSIFYIQSTEKTDYYQVSIDNNGVLKCNCSACRYGHKKCIHCYVTELLLYLDKN